MPLAIDNSQVEEKRVVRKTNLLAMEAKRIMVYDKDVGRPQRGVFPAGDKQMQIDAWPHHVPPYGALSSQ